MKYLVTESQIDRFIFKYIDLKRFIRIDKGDKIYFTYLEGDEYAQIRYDKDNGWCFINFDLNKEISSFFSLQRSESKKVISRWVENTLQMEVTYTSSLSSNPAIIVENTLQMEVTYTSAEDANIRVLLRIPN